MFPSVGVGFLQLLSLTVFSRAVVPHEGRYVESGDYLLRLDLYLSVL
jgi:hypothetical protein